MLRAILEFPVLFLGAKPSDTPAFYNFMNYADFGLGTFQPKNGFYDVVQAMIKLGESLGVSFYNNSNVTKVITEKNKVIGLEINEKIIKSDIVVSGADYNFTEKLLPKNLRQYSDKYWDKRTLAPSALLFYIGFNKKLNNITFTKANKFKLKNMYYPNLKNPVKNNIDISKRNVIPLKFKKSHT